MIHEDGYLVPIPEQTRIWEHITAGLHRLKLSARMPHQALQSTGKEHETSQDMTGGSTGHEHAVRNPVDRAHPTRSAPAQSSHCDQCVRISGITVPRTVHMQCKRRHRSFRRRRRIPSGAEKEQCRRTIADDGGHASARRMAGAEHVRRRHCMFAWRRPAQSLSGKGLAIYSGLFPVLPRDSVAGRTGKGRCRNAPSAHFQTQFQSAGTGFGRATDRAATRARRSTSPWPPNGASACTAPTAISVGKIFSANSARARAI